MSTWQLGRTVHGRGFWQNKYYRRPLLWMQALHSWQSYGSCADCGESLSQGCSTTLIRLPCLLSPPPPLCLCRLSAHTRNVSALRATSLRNTLAHHHVCFRADNGGGARNSDALRASLDRSPTGRAQPQGR